jgi:hypothetical protein
VKPLLEVFLEVLLESDRATLWHSLGAGA